MALVFTQTDLDNLKAALVSGATKVKVGDREVEYRKQSDLLAAIQMVQSYLEGVSDDVDDNPNVINATYVGRRQS